MPFITDGAENRVITEEELQAHLKTFCDKYSSIKKLLLVPPDITRLNSRAGEITAYLYNYFRLVRLVVA